MRTERGIKRNTILHFALTPNSYYRSKTFTFSINLQFILQEEKMRTEILKESTGPL